MENLSIKRLLLTSVIFLLFVNVGFSQDTGEKLPKEELVSPQTTISLDNLSSETEKLSQRITRLRDILQPSAEILDIDTSLTIMHSNIVHRRDTLISILPQFSHRDLQKESVDWSENKSVLEEYQSTIDSRVKVLNSVNDEVDTNIKLWKTTKETLVGNNESSELFSNMDTIILNLEGIANIALVRLDSALITQKNLSQLTLIIDEVIAEINNSLLQLQKDYFVFDSPALWNFKKINNQYRDSISADTIVVQQKNFSGFKDDYSHLLVFIKKNIKTTIFQIISVLMLLGLMLFVRMKWNTDKERQNNRLENEAKIVINNPLAASLVVGTLISAFFYPVMIPTFRDLLVLIVLAGTSYLLPKLTHKKIFVPLLIILFVQMMKTIEIYIAPETILSRLLLLLNIVLVSYAFKSGYVVMNKYPYKFNRIAIFRKYIILIYLAFMFAAFVANIIGMVNMARFFMSAVLTSVALGAVVFLSMKVFTSIIILILKLRSQFSLRTLTTWVEVIQKRIRPFLMLGAIIIWMFFTLKGFEIYDYLKIWVNDILDIHWKLVNATISIGGILAFIFIFMITMFIAKIVANIFQDEWLIKVLPRGIAPAISLITRIVLISTGFYMGLSAAGFDFSKIGLMLGALGVGIGFGLQSVVLNFISGLILAFERPINLGDAIEVDQEQGIITSIGVRASNIRTWDGSEVIIPNGDLVSKKVVNWTLSNRDRRRRILMKTSSDADPEKVIELFNRIAGEHPSVYKNPAPYTLFYGYNQEGNLDFSLIYWCSFSDFLNADSDIALKIYKTLKAEGIQAPIPKWKIVGDDDSMK